MDRRDVIQRVLLGGAALIIMPSALTSCEKKTDPDPTPGPGGTNLTVDLTLAQNASLNSTGGSKIIQTLLVVNTGTGFIALSSICTHEGCTVGYDSAAGNIKCPCHGSSYTTTGSVITGPTVVPLAAYPVSKAGNILTISL
jgi:cytochrome b6-f complex iron-sulfur subunit